MVVVRSQPRQFQRASMTPKLTDTVVHFADSSPGRRLPCTLQLLTNTLFTEPLVCAPPAHQMSWGASTRPPQTAVIGYGRQRGIMSRLVSGHCWILHHYLLLLVSIRTRDESILGKSRWEAPLSRRGSTGSVSSASAAGAQVPPPCSPRSRYCFYSGSCKRREWSC